MAHLVNIIITLRVIVTFEDKWVWLYDICGTFDEALNTIAG